jgi:hypothetical protein
MTLQTLKQHEGKRVFFKYRGRFRPFILQAVQDVQPDVQNLIRGQYLGNYGEARLDYDFPSKGREWAGFWTKRIENISLTEVK